MTPKDQEEAALKSGLVMQSRSRGLGKSLEVLYALDGWIKAATVGDRLFVATASEVRVFELVEIRKEGGGT